MPQPVLAQYQAHLSPETAAARPALLDQEVMELPPAIPLQQLGQLSQEVPTEAEVER